VTPGFLAKLSPVQQRALAVALFVAVLVIGLLVLLGPLILLHRHYDRAIAETTDRVGHLVASPHKHPSCAARSIR